jgi:hypothetical protein
MIPEQQLDDFKAALELSCGVRRFRPPAKLREMRQAGSPCADFVHEPLNQVCESPIPLPFWHSLKVMRTSRLFRAVRQVGRGCLVLLFLCSGLSAVMAAERSIGACILEAPPAYTAQLDALAEQAVRLLPRLEADLDVQPRGAYRIFLIPPSAMQDDELHRLDASAPSWAAGFLFPARRVGGLRLSRAGSYPHDDLTSVLVHEATHMLLHDAAGHRLPRWFGEGVATWEGRRWGLQDLFVYSSGLLTNRMPPLEDLDGWFRQSPERTRIAYAASFDFVSWSVRRHGPEILGSILHQAADRPFPDAWEAATGSTLAAAEASWRRRSMLRYRWIPALVGTTALWSGITLLAFLAGVRRRARSRRIQARWDQEDTRRHGGGPSDPGLPPGGPSEIH